MKEIHLLLHAGGSLHISNNTNPSSQPYDERVPGLDFLYNRLKMNGDYSGDRVDHQQHSSSTSNSQKCPVVLFEKLTATQLGVYGRKG